jgi:hypothetical protein
MKLNQIPLIYNIDKVYIYDNGEKVAEQWIGGHGLRWYFQEVETLKPYADRKADSMAINLEGDLIKTVVLEIYL